MGDEDPKGAYNRAPLFKCENYAYWKENMYVHLMSVDKNIWVETIDGPFIPKNEVDNVINLPKYWTDDETNKALYDLTVENILICALSAKLYYFISYHKNAQTVWNAL